MNVPIPIFSSEDQTTGGWPHNVLALGGHIFLVFVCYVVIVLTILSKNTW